ncbi:hypothetical protein GIB67_014613 [Kingdonia uniflora]|uniref:Uncharacterized protein n=1 Tax=Kingdonia uniflora TaxID=39325 RepID=A0A7J7NVB0_9MAGN|nr:hypothetical protein GIB67_014613 [Kingdonia uniflora]
MNSVCISRCVDDVRVPVRATYVNLYKWPESDAEFVKSLPRGGGGDNDRKVRNSSRVVDSISCRQMYLRSYTFSTKKETVPEKTKKCFVRVKEIVIRRKRIKDGGDANVHSGCRKWGRKVKEISCVAFFSFFNKLLSCTTSVDVVDHRD